MWWKLRGNEEMVIFLQILPMLARQDFAKGSHHGSLSFLIPPIQFCIQTKDCAHYPSHSLSPPSNFSIQTRPLGRWLWGVCVLNCLQPERYYCQLGIQSSYLRTWIVDNLIDKVFLFKNWVDEYFTVLFFERTLIAPIVLVQCPRGSVVYIM